MCRHKQKAFYVYADQKGSWKQQAEGKHVALHQTSAHTQATVIMDKKIDGKASSRYIRMYKSPKLL